MKIVDYNSAFILNKLGFDEWTQDLYMAAHIGIKGVKTDNDGNTVAERVWHTGDLCPRDESWEISYPSANWIPAPYVFDAVNWLETYMNIKIIPVYTKNKTWTYEIEIPNILYFLCPDAVQEPGKTYMFPVNHTEYVTTETMYDSAIKYMSMMATKLNWLELIETKFWSKLECNETNNHTADNKLF